MALYRTGTAAMDAQGVIIGTGTKWREPLSLIRTGATIVFLTSPLKLAVISDIVSDTEMKAIQTDGEPVENGNYVILLNDSLTVDGMAQDVAETLRYYQSKETVIEEAIEFFKNFDLKTIQDLVARAEASAQKTDADRAATEQLKNDTQTIKDDAVTETQQIKDAAVSETQQIKNAAVAETNQIKADTDAIKNQTQQIKDSAVTEITGIKNEALDARDEAEEARDLAEQSKIAADSAKAGADAARDDARQWAQQVNPENLLHKDQNLADVANKSEARVNLDVYSKSQSNYVYLRKDGNLSGLADRAAAWLNVRPIGSTPLSSDPVDELDAVTKRWVLGKMSNVDVYNSFQAIHNPTVLPEGATAGGWVTSRLQENGVNVADSSMSVALTKGSDVAVTRISAVSRVGGVLKQSIFALDSLGNISCEAEARGKAFSGRDGAFGPAVIKRADRSSTDIDNVNYISQVENNTTKIYQYVVTPGGRDQQFVTRMDVTGSDIKYFSIRVDNGMYTPEGRCAIQGSDVRIKDRFEPPKLGAWERVKQIGVMEFYYKGNHVLQRGYLAQQMAEIDDTYVFFGGTATDENGDEFEIMNVNDRAVISDLIVVVQELQKDNEEMKEEIAEMKTAMAEMKVMLAQLTK